MCYADDSQLYIAVNSNDDPQASLDILRDCIQSVFHWSTQNMLHTNSSKTEVIYFTSRFQKQPISLGTFEINNTQVTFSGKVLNLTFKNHINKICKTAQLAIYTFYWSYSQMPS